MRLKNGLNLGFSGDLPSAVNVFLGGENAEQPAV